MNDQYVYGVHAVAALLANRLRPIKMLHVNQERVDKRIQDLLNQAEKIQVPIERLSAQKMNQKFADVSHQGIVATAGKLPEYIESDLGCLFAQCRCGRR